MIIADCPFRTSSKNNSKASRASRPLQAPHYSSYKPPNHHQDVWRTALVSSLLSFNFKSNDYSREQDKEATVYIGNIDERVTDSLIWELMLQAGRIVNVHLPKDRVTQTHQGYGFVEFISEEDAEYAARIMNQVRLYGKPIRVNKVRRYSSLLLCFSSRNMDWKYKMLTNRTGLSRQAKTPRSRRRTLHRQPRPHGRRKNPLRYLLPLWHPPITPQNRPRRIRPLKRLRICLLPIIRSLRRRNRKHERAVSHEQRYFCSICL